MNSNNNNNIINNNNNIINLIAQKNIAEVLHTRVVEIVPSTIDSISEVYYEVQTRLIDTPTKTAVVRYNSKYEAIEHYDKVCRVFTRLSQEIDTVLDACIDGRYNLFSTVPCTKAEVYQGLGQPVSQAEEEEREHE